MVDENVLIFDSKEETEPFFFHGSKQNCRDLQKKQNKELNFGFDRVFGCNSSNEAVFEVSTKDIVKSLLDGFNCSGEYFQILVFISVLYVLLPYFFILITIVLVSKDCICNSVIKKGCRVFSERFEALFACVCGKKMYMKP